MLPQFSHKTILICPLNWGLGHAARMVPVVKYYLYSGNRVILAADGNALNFLKHYFPDLEHILLPDVKIKYRKNIVLGIIFSLPEFFKQVKKENKCLTEIIKHKQIDVVISDNRYGLYSKDAECYIVTHQLNIPIPVLGMIANKIIHHYVQKFKQCLVPDVKDVNSLSGKLSRINNKRIHAIYVGILSRFSGPLKFNIERSVDILFLISGPEPQRTEFEKIACKIAERLNKKIVIVRGIVNNEPVFESHNLCLYNHLTDKVLQQILSDAKLVVSRSGYSSLMDYEVLNMQNVLLVPTPGQPEQLYLAKYLYQKGKYNFVYQHKLYNYFCPTE